MRTSGSARACTSAPKRVACGKKEGRNVSNMDGGLLIAVNRALGSFARKVFTRHSESGGQKGDEEEMRCLWAGREPGTYSPAREFFGPHLHRKWRRRFQSQYRNNF
ncbi:hypothetical protein TRVL_07572 [Trypanosoma vivax]|nr:hypothetical protein TRVL_07572 [Trypanosoma vivax]